RPPPGSTLFPYTTLFRSRLETRQLRLAEDAAREALAVALEGVLDAADLDHVGADAVDHRAACSMRLFISRTASRMPTKTARLTRSEEHTSELQSQSNLVC